MIKVKIIIADDHPLFLKGLKDALEEDNSLEVIGTASNGTEALEKIESLRPDVITLDLDMPFINGITVAKTVLQNAALKNTKLIILSMHKDPHIVRTAMAIGIHGYVFKDDAVNDLVQAVKTVNEGNIFLPPGFEDDNSIDSTQLIQRLSKMEKQILNEIASGQTSSQIAEKFFISLKTVENHRSNICKKLEISGSNSLVKFAMSIQKLLI